MVFGKDALGPQRRRDRNRPAFSNRLQRCRGGVVLDAGAGEDGNARALAEKRNRSLGRRQAERHNAVEEIGNRHILRIAIRDQDIVSK